MLLEKLITTRINISDPNKRNSPKIKEIILEELKKKYENKCYAASMIKEITGIEKMSSIKINFALDGSSYVDVIFRAKVIVLLNDTIFNCTVVNKEDRGSTVTIIAKNDTAYIHISEFKKQMDFFKIGYSYPMIAKETGYPIGEERMAVLGSPYLPIFMKDIPCIYMIKEPLSHSETESLGYLFNMVSEKAKILENYSKKSKKIYTFFKNFVTPYRLPSKLPTSLKGFQPVPIDSKTFTSLDNGYLYFCSASQTLLYNKSTKFKPANDPDIGTILEENMLNICNSILNKHIIYLDRYIGLIENYPDANALNKYNHLWGIFRKLKLS